MKSTLNERIAEETIAIRNLKDDLAAAKASAENAAIEAAGGAKNIGSNDTERKVALERAVNESTAWRQVLRDLRKHEAELDRLNAKLGDENAAAQRDRWITRAKLAEALETLAMQAPRYFFSGRDFDSVVDELTGEVVGRLASLAGASRNPALTPPAALPVRSPKVEAYHAEAARRQPRGVDPAQDDVDDLFDEDQF